MSSNEQPVDPRDGADREAGAAGSTEPGYQAVRPSDQGFEQQRPTTSYPGSGGGYSSEYGGYQPARAATASYPPPSSPYGASGQYSGTGQQAGYHGGWTPQPQYGQNDWRPQSDTAQLGSYPPAGPEHPDEAASTKPGRRPMLALALVAALVGGGVGGGIVAAVDHNNGNTVNSGIKITNSTGAPAAKLDGTVGAAAAKIRPSVVTINVTGQQEAGTGSGVIIRPNGTILTNDHVVDISGGTGNIQVVLSDGRTATAKILGRDTSDDLAVIKVDGLSNLTAATFAKSSSLTVGQTVVAVGAPLGLSDTVTSGIVSNVARPVRAGDNDQAVFNAVQTDAAINPGNSGGPLVDLNGSVVGINAAIASDNSGGGGLQIPGQQSQAGNIGIGFAIPSDEASRIAGELIATGKATHAVLGVEVTTTTTATSTAGVPLHSVTAGGVADKAGLKVGDLVTKIDDQQVTTADALIAAVRSHAPGEQVTVTYTRGGTTNSVKVTLGSSNS